MSRSLDRLTLLETFIRISERGSISAAARDLGMAQGSASRQLQALEDRLGIQLMHRTTHALALTPAGREVLADARELVARWAALEEAQAGEGGALAGPLGVVAPVALGQRHLADIAIRFQAEHPGVVLDWRLEDGPLRFAETGCDCWIRIGPIPDERLVQRRLGRVERLLVATPALAARLAAPDPEAAARLPLLALTPFEGARILLAHGDGRRHALTAKPAMATNNILALRRAAGQGLGIAVLPRWFVAEELAGGTLVDLLPGWRAPALDVMLGYPPARHRPRRLTAFLEALEAGMARIPGLAP